MRCGRAFGFSVLFSLFLRTARPLDNQNHGNRFLETQCHFQLFSGQDETILAVETRDLDASSFLASSKLGCTTGLVFKLNPGPTGIRRIPAIVSSRDVNVNNNTAASTGVRRNIKNLIRITFCHNNPTPQRPLNFLLMELPVRTQ